MRTDRKREKEMGSLKPSVRSKATNLQQQPILANGTVPHLEGGVFTNELRAFHADKFDADGYVLSKCQTMNEKGIRNLCSELVNLKKVSAEEMRRSVYANYAAFIRTSQEISDLEEELLAMRNLLSNQVALIHGLAEGVQVEAVPNGMDAALGNDSYIEDEHRPSELEKRAQALPDILDVLLAERRVDEALAVLNEGEKIASGTMNKEIMSVAASSWLQAALSDRRAKLAEQLVEAAHQPSVRGSELRAAILALDRLGDGARAHTLLLQSHHERLQYNIQGLRPSGTLYGGAYTAALSQLVFSAIAQAAKDSSAVFGDQPAYASEFVLWACNESENFAMLVKRHILSSAAAAGGLRAAAECVQIAIGHCSLLEVQGLALGPVLLKLFRPNVEQALEANLKLIDESVSALAAADDWVLAYPVASAHPASRPSHTSAQLATLLRLSSSAHRFHTMVQDFFEDVVPLISMQLGALMLDGLLHLFESYVQLLIKAVSSPVEGESLGQTMDSRTVKEAQAEGQQLGILCNASALAEELLPRAAAKLFPGQHIGREDPRKRASERHSLGPSRILELREWRRHLQSMVDRLRDHYCRQQVLDLVYSEEGEANLSVDLYLNWDANGDDPYWHNDPMPSPIFQELFMKLNKISHVAVDVLVGRERATALLLMRLVETFLIWLSDDQEFWEDLEDSPRPLGPIGLQQFVLDMQFVIQIASHGRYLSRQMRHVTADIITRAVEAFGRTGLDPNSVLPENEWFVTIAQDAVNKLFASWCKGGQAEIPSPTASVSAHSVSSMRSNGSN
eukprot:c27915_g1_i1 orf=735-3119(-)